MFHIPSEVPLISSYDANISPKYSHHRILYPLYSVIDNYVAKSLTPIVHHYLNSQYQQITEFCDLLHRTFLRNCGIKYAFCTFPITAILLNYLGLFLKKYSDQLKDYF